MWVPPISLLRATVQSEPVRQTAHLRCAFPDSALRTADKLSDMARGQGLAAWVRPRYPGEWEIRFEGDEDQLRGFATKLGFKNVENALAWD
jgi:hypothetical protein